MLLELGCKMFMLSYCIRTLTRYFRINYMVQCITR